MRSITALAAAGLLFVSGLASAGPRDELNAFTQGLKRLDGRFTQQVFDAKGRLKEKSTGRIALAAPRQFRWEYATPYPQLVVADGNTVWIYEPDLKQVTRRAQGAEERNSPLAVLIDPSRLDAQFTVKDAGTADGLQWLLLTPKGDAAAAGFRTARLGLAKGSLARMQVVDQLGQRTEIAFSGWKRNPSLPASTFRYVPPKGVDVIGG